MVIVDKKPIPIYESKCHECGTVFRYKKAEVSWTGYITCPICYNSVWANTINPVEFCADGEVATVKDEDSKTSGDVKNATSRET